MTIIKGSDIHLFAKINGELEAIAHATNHTFSIEADKNETSSKDTGKWKDHEVTKLGWSATSENLIGGLSSGSALATLIDKQISKEPIDVHLTLASNADNDAGVPEEGWTPDATVGWKGKATIDRVEMNAPDGQNSTMSITLTGKGELKKASAL